MHELEGRRREGAGKGRDKDLGGHGPAGLTMGRGVGEGKKDPLMQ